MKLVKKIRQVGSRIKTKDGKVILENFISLSALQTVGMILPLITLPYVLRVIGFEKYGIIVFAASLVAYFQALTDFSFKVTAVRDVALFKGSPRKLNYIYSKVVTIKAIFLFVSLLTIGAVVLLYPPFRELKHIYGLSALMLIGSTLFPEWFFQGIEKMRYITILNIGVKIFFTLCVFVFIRSEDDYWIYPLLQGGGLIGAGIIGQIMLRFKYSLRFILLPKRVIKNTIVANGPIFINQFIPTLYNNTSTFLLGLMGTKVMVGIYQSLLVIVNLCVTVLGILSRIFFPFLIRKKESFSKYKEMMITIVLGMMAFILISHKLIFRYLSITDDQAFQVLLVLVIGLFGYTLSNIFGLNYFIVHRQDRLVMKNTVRASIIGFLLAFPLIHFYGILGAAVNLSLSRWLMGGGLYLKYLGYRDKLFSNKNSM